MLPRTYLETSLISYVVGRPSRDVITFANQQLTREWWETQRLNYELFVSELVIAEKRRSATRQLRRTGCLW